MIKIETVVLENFRRYKNAEFDFTKNDSKNDIILAGNGVGKSTFFDALTWCLFNSEDHLDIDPVYKTEAEGLLNTKIAVDLKPRSGVMTKVTIFLYDTENKTRYKAERAVKFEKNNEGEILDNLDHPQFTLSVKQDENEWANYSGDKAEHQVDKIIPLNLRQFFFFDGEKLRQHFESSTSDYLSKKILQLSRIEYITKAYQHLDAYYLEIDRRINKKITDVNLKKLKEEINLKTTLLNDATKDLEEFKDKLASAKKNQTLFEQAIIKAGASIQEVNEINEELRKNKARVDTLEKDNTNLTKNKHDLILDITPQYFLIEKVKKANEILNDAIDKKIAPPPITEEYLRRIISSTNCICGTKLDGKDNVHKHNLEELLLRVKGLRDANVNKGVSTLEEFIHKSDSFLKDMNSIQERINLNIKEINSANESIEMYENKLNRCNVKEIEKNKKFLEGIKEEIDSLNRDIRSKELEIYDLDFDLKKKNQKATIDEEKEGIEKDLKEKRDKADLMRKNFNKLKDYLIERNSRRLEKSTEKYVKELLTEKAHEISAIKIKRNYELVIQSKTNENINLRHTLSAGETQIFVLSFAAALREVVDQNAPLVIDTPLGKIDANYRKGVIFALSKLFPQTQLILLVTDSEFNEETRKYFKDSLKSFNEFEVVKDKSKAFNEVVMS
jgi:DNA sulfur modification protein DndD